MNSEVVVNMRYEFSDEMINFIGTDLRERAKAWATEYWGERCADYETDCACCKAWQAIDTLFAGLDP